MSELVLELLRWGSHVTLTDATLILLLADRIHGTDSAIRAAAKRCAKQLPRSQRELIYKVVDSPSPSKLLAHLCATLDEVEELSAD